MPAAPRAGRGPPPGPERPGCRVRHPGRAARPTAAVVSEIVTRGIATSARRDRRPRTATDASARVATAMTSTPSTSRASSTADAGHDDPADPPPRQRGHHRQDARDRADLAAEAELADQRDRRAVRTNLLGAEQDADGDRQIQGRTGLAQLGGCEIDGDPARRKRRTRRCGSRRGRVRGPPGPRCRPARRS